MGEARIVIPAKRAKKTKRTKVPAPRARKVARKSSPRPPVPEGTRDEWYPLASDPGLHAAGVEIGARATFKQRGPPQLRIVFRAGSKEASVDCVHVAVYTGSLKSLPSEAELAQSSEHRPIRLAPDEHFFALKSYVAGIAEVGLGAMFTAAREAGHLSVGFNALMQQQVLRALLQVAPAGTLDLCIWVIEDATQAVGESSQVQGYLVPIKTLVAENKDTPQEVLARLAGDADFDVRDAVARNGKWSNCSPEILARLAGDADKDIRRVVAWHMNTPPEVLARLAGDADKEMRRAVAKHLCTLPEVLARLAGDANKDIRRAVAWHRNTPPEVLTRLAEDVEVDVRGGVACNERTPPETLARLAKSCPICQILGEKRFVDWGADQDFPDEERKLVMVMEFDYSNDLRKCPLCGTYYDFHFETDNDIWPPPQTHTGEYKRIPAEKAEQMVREENARLEKQKKDYKRQVRRLHGAIIDTLPEVEKRIVNYLAERLYKDIWVEDIQKNVGLDAATMDTALGHLVQSKVVTQLKSGNYREYSIRLFRS